MRAVEYDPQISAVYAQNLGAHILTGDVRTVDYTGWKADLLHASPPCPNFSVAKTGRGETVMDLELADAVCRALRAIRPRAFTLENVRGYERSESYRRVRACLDELDYWSHATVVNAADMGVPQTRERLILRAVSGGWMQPFRPLPAPVPWVGWYAAIEDLIPTLPESQFAPWQLARLPEEIRESILVGGANMSALGAAPGVGVSGTHAPTYVINASNSIQTRAFLLDGEGSSHASGLLRADGGEPVMTVGASQSRQPMRADVGGRVVKLTPRALARFQTLPDWYALPPRASLACRIIGNGVPCLLMQRIAESLS